MGYEIEKMTDGLTADLSIAFENATSIINKSYLDKLEEYNLVIPSEEDIDIDIAECGRFYKLSKLVFNKEENFLDKLLTIINVAFSVEGSIATIIKSDGKHIQYYLGVISKNYRMNTALDRKKREAAAKAFKGAILGNLMGSDLTTLTANEVSDLQQHIFDHPEQAVSAISGIVSLRGQGNKYIENYVQGIENLTDSLKGQKYTIVLLADPITTNEIQVIKQGYEMLYTQLATFLGSTVTFNQSDTLTLSKTQTEGITHGISTGIALTQSKSKSKGKFKSINANVGINLGISAGVGVGFGTNTGESNSWGKTNSTTQSSGQSRSYSNTTSRGTTEGKSLQLNYENRSVKGLLEKIDKYLERLDSCENFGAFDCAAYVLADNREDALTVASNYNALMRGEGSGIQASHINTWHKPEQTSILYKYLHSFVHPRFYTQDKIIVTPSSILSGRELAIQIGLPKKSINGISVVQTEPFGRNIVVQEQGNHITLGNLYHMGQVEQEAVELDINSLASHTFISGSTGAGKSNAIYHILNSLDRKDIHFMIIEPAKGEYKHIFGNRKDVNVFGTNPHKMPLLKINPFRFPDDIHVLEHIDRLIEIFNVCWPMYAAMPAILKEAVERAYIIAGWDLETSYNKYEVPLYPTFLDVLQELSQVINESDFSGELKSNYTGALITRVKSLTNGINGQIFVADEIDNTLLFDKNTIIDLSRVSSMETKAMIMGILIMRLQEYRMAAGGMNKPLQHITVLEEAHNLLKRTSTEQSPEGANLLGKSVEMLSQSIAEMRTYGEGFIIADQSPHMLDMSVIRNTNTKIILRLPDMSDRQLCGRAANLNDEQIIELAKLPTGVAAVYQNNWIEPVLCKINKYKEEINEYSYQGKSLRNRKDKLKETLIRCLLSECVEEKVKYSTEDLVEQVIEAQLPIKSKLAIIEALNNKSNSIDTVKTAITSLFDTNKLFEALNSTTNIKEFNQRLTMKLNFDFCNLHIAYKYATLQCIIKEISATNPKLKGLYDKWVAHMKQGEVE